MSEFDDLFEQDKKQECLNEEQTTSKISEEEKQKLIDEIMNYDKPKYEMPKFVNAYHNEDLVYEEKNKVEKHKNFSLIGICFILILSMICGYAGSYIFYKQQTTTTENSYYAKANNSASNIVIKTISEDGTVSLTGDLSIVGETASKTVVLIQTTLSGAISQGSGVIFGQDNKYVYIVTNLHVVNGFDSSASNPIVVETISSNVYNAYFVGADAANDIAVIKVEIADMVSTDINTATVGNSDNLKPFNDVIAIGNALGEGFSFTKGVVSSLGTKKVVMDLCVFNLIQTDTTINSGNSGGGLFDATGALVGIVNAKSVGDSIEGTGYAIPINTAIEVARNICQNVSDGKGYNPNSIYVGLSVEDYTTQTGNYLYLTSNAVADSNTYVNTATGLNYSFVAGSYITQIKYENGDSTKSWILSGSSLTASEFAQKLTDLSIGEVITFTIHVSSWRTSQTYTVNCTLNQYVYPN